MKKRMGLLMGAFLLSFAGLSQTGTIYGKLLEADSSSAIPFAKVWVDTPGGQIGQLTDADGRFKISGLPSGTYIAYGKTVGSPKKGYKMEVKPDGLHRLNIILGDNMLDEIIVDANALKIETDLITHRISAEEIARSPYVRSPIELLAATASDIKMVEGSDQVIIRGSRPGDAIFYLDGVKMESMTSLPGAAIGGIQAYTSGVPARYGDTTGGVIVVESKSYSDLYYAWKARQ